MICGGRSSDQRPTRQYHQRPTSQLDLSEANLLCAALVQSIADRAGLRVLIIKGLGLSYYSLRSNHSSSDTDVLVEPGGLHQLLRALEEIGWERRSLPSVDSIRTLHSIALCHRDWPSDIDLHLEFPGLLASPVTSFEVLWREARPILVAGRQCWIPDRPSSIAMWALHSLRGNSQTQTRHATELAQLLQGTMPRLSDRARAELADRIVAVGADEPLRVIPEFAEIIGDRHGPQAPGALEAWNAKVAQAHEATPWLQVLRDARPSERPWLLFRAVWPSAHDLRLLDELLIDTPLGRVQSRGRRARRLVRRVVERRRQAH